MRRILIDMGLISMVVIVVVVGPLWVLSVFGAGSKAESPKQDKEFAIQNSEFYNEFDIVYVESTDTGWEVSTEQYGTLFVDMTYNQAISMASVLTWVGYQCDYYCKEEMVDKALSEHYQLMYHE